MLLVGTANRDKLNEFRTILDDLSVEVAGVERLPDLSAVPEHGETFLENARLKARTFARRALALPPARRPRWVVADDSGLEVAALGGAPGITSARYAGEGASAADRNRKLLHALRGVPEERRQAQFVCALACAAVADPPPIAFEVEARCPGMIATAPRGSGGFGYDPIFVESSTGRTFAEMPPGEKNRLSHRARALEAFRLWLEGQLGIAAPGGHGR